jgi:hypothetical protein
MTGMAVQQRWFKFKPVDPAVSKVSGKKRKSKSKPKTQHPGNATRLLATSSSKVKVEPGFTPDDGDDDNSDIEIVESAVIKRTKLEVQTADEDDDASVQISIYISVSSVAPPITCVDTRTIKAPPPKSPLKVPSPSVPLLLISHFSHSSPKLFVVSLPRSLHHKCNGNLIALATRNQDLSWMRWDTMS